MDPDPSGAEPDSAPPSPPSVSTDRRLTTRAAAAVRRERRLWDGRADSWDEEGSTGLVAVTQAVVDACAPTAGLVAVDLGAGSGQVTIPLARTAAEVIAVDVSPRSIARLQAKCDAGSITNIRTHVASLQALELAPDSVDLVVSDYALHHLDDGEKAELLARAHIWLRPGGRLIVGDMMFGRGATGADRRIIAGKVTSLARRGPGGWWRIAKNVWRFGLRRGERPLPRGRWESLAREAGFADVRTVPVVAEAALLLARRPEAPAGAAPGSAPDAATATHRTRTPVGFPAVPAGTPSPRPTTRMPPSPHE